jgi:signal transduction histidine kinase
MMSAPQLSPEAKDDVRRRAGVLRGEYQTALWKRTDRLFAVLLLLQWVASVAIAVWISPWSWEGLDRYVNPHIWTAVWLDGLIAAMPIYLVITQPGKTSTRMVISVAQMLQSAVLIHLSGGRIETHFHIFGSLAFLSFYREWRVLVPATLVVAIDHALRGTYLPESIFGVLSASPWRVVEHVGWVVFEDIFLVWACVVGTAELVLLASRQAELESINSLVEQEVARKTSQLATVTQQLIASARLAGMAEVATGVLHNVGNVLNSVNISANMIAEKLDRSAASNLSRATEMIESHKDDLAAFLTADEKGMQLPRYFSMVGKAVVEENAAIRGELSSLASGIEHIKRIVQLQQSSAKASTIRAAVDPLTVVEDALRMSLPSLERHGIAIVRQIQSPGVVEIDAHKTVQILVNLIANAKNAVRDAAGVKSPTITIGLRAIERDGAGSLQYEVADNGVGISPEILSQLFRHGFTTRPEGHGFGLHSAVNAAREMGGNLTAASEGIGCGARFTLEIPFVPAMVKAA